MRIVIDRDITADGTIVAEHVLQTDDSAWITHPITPQVLLTPIQYIALLNGHPALQAQLGWGVSKQLTNEPQQFTRWQRLLAHTASAQGDPQLKLLALKDGS